MTTLFQSLVGMLALAVAAALALEGSLWCILFLLMALAAFVATVPEADE